MFLQNRKMKIPVAFITLLCSLTLLFAACGSTQGPVETVISNRTADAFLSIEVMGAMADYTITREGSTFICPQLEDAAPSPQATDILAQGCTDLTAMELTGALITDAQYGLQNPKTRATISYTDGATLTLLIGNRAPDEETGESSGYYFSIEGKNIVYTSDAPVFDYIVGGPSMFAALSLTAFDYAPGDAGLPDNITLTLGDERYVLDKLPQPETDGFGNTYTYTLTSHGGAYVDPESFSTYFSACTNMFAAEVVLNPSAAQIEALCPTSSPDSLTLSYAGESITLRLGTQETSGALYTYVVKAGTDALYSVAPRYVPFLSVDEYRLVTRYIAAPAMEDVLNITVITPGEGDFFVIDVYDGAAFIEGAHLDENTFSGLYRLLCSLQAEYQLEQTVENTNVGSVTISFRMVDGSTFNIKLVPYETGRYAIFINDEPARYAVRTAFADKVLHTLSQITNGQIIDPAW
ncbi:DUF4340 domain-containing protein [Ruminococcaceae bacterium OttesenSCG-928-N02]|nr:DUF4340 domain-containing protein [Ruminococcaceae bacterium OttesenSCG-928-N02]